MTSLKIKPPYQGVKNTNAPFQELPAQFRLLTVGELTQTNCPAKEYAHKQLPIVDLTEVVNNQRKLKDVPKENLFICDPDKTFTSSKKPEDQPYNWMRI